MTAELESAGRILVGGEPMILESVANEPSDEPNVIKKRLSVRRLGADGKYSVAQDIVVTVQKNDEL